MSSETMRERFEKLKQKVYPSEIIGHVLPDGADIPDHAIDSRKVQVTEKTWKQSEPVLDFIESEISRAVAKERERCIKPLENEREICENSDQFLLRDYFDLIITTIKNKSV